MTRNRPGQATGAATEHSDTRTLSEARTGTVQAFANADDWWRDCATRALTWMAELGQPFDAWDLVALGVPEPDNFRRWGGLFQAAHKQGLIKRVGFAPSRRPSAAGSIVSVWQGTRKSVVRPRRAARPQVVPDA